MIELGLKIDVDTERGTRIGVPRLLSLFKDFGIKATFLFSLGPDNTGRAIKRIFRPGFFAKVSRTSVLKVYGIRTLCNGVLWPGPHIANKHASIMKRAQDEGHEVGIHCYDHIRWQDHLHAMTTSEVAEEVNKAHRTFLDVFGFKAQTMGAAGWQTSKHSLVAYDQHDLLYASDARGEKAFFPRVDDHVFKTLQIPTTLPTLDELIGRPDYPTNCLVDHYRSLMKPQQLNTFTLHAELEGMAYFDWFQSFLKRCQVDTVSMGPLAPMVEQLLRQKDKIPVLPLVQGTVDGRSGLLATHGSLAR
ncbi:MAG: polysaccharide deacetylase family protein [Alphaproteobacteria bacterium]|nr:polysaccharide deacetylase family protein [Alphaproteobacteria bacterium]